ncbi:hypothetical protein E2562_012777 [Oryza meyeriana var. granulata]|uniref:Uncharacterized protein n=1 Tax=Oryza meyeriana var. granulata TaxID=110450 RepID=A0A6G1DHR9_9ORYZ|nr:hypothetical protein E2562_012777 [Oryza meyeriana var. granulata]
MELRQIEGVGGHLEGTGNRRRMLTSQVTGLAVACSPPSLAAASIFLSFPSPVAAAVFPSPILSQPWFEIQRQEGSDRYAKVGRFRCAAILLRHGLTSRAILGSGALMVDVSGDGGAVGIVHQGWRRWHRHGPMDGGDERGDAASTAETEGGTIRGE